MEISQKAIDGFKPDEELIQLIRRHALAGASSATYILNSSFAHFQEAYVYWLKKNGYAVRVERDEVFAHVYSVQLVIGW